MYVLIVDDDMATADMIFQAISWKALGIERVEKAYNAEQARKFIRQGDPQIIISDIEMPRESGLELLAWYRQENYTGEFVFLTSYANFSYAADAVRFQAAEYLLKPLNISVMEAAIRKLIVRIRSQKELYVKAELGEWAHSNRGEIRRQFLHALMDGHITGDESEICMEMRRRGISLDMSASWRLVVTRMTEMDAAREKVNPDLLIFMIGNIHSEILCGTLENDSVYCRDYQDYFLVVTFCGNADAERLHEQCGILHKRFKEIFEVTVTCCISRKCSPADFYAVHGETVSRVFSNVLGYGSIFEENDSQKSAEAVRNHMDISALEKFLADRRNMNFMGYVRDYLNEHVRTHSLDKSVLLSVQQDVLQAAYQYLSRRNIMAPGLITNQELLQRASNSVIDMLKWVSCLLEQVDYFVQDVLQSRTVVDQINQFISEHYREEIGRNEIARWLFLTPEHVSRMYKKQTGVSLTDYINMYRIEKAKALLEETESSVSEIAVKVGYDNFTYFSTLFKKYVGITPNQYRKLKN